MINNRTEEEKQQDNERDRRNEIFSFKLMACVIGSVLLLHGCNNLSEISAFRKQNNKYRLFINSGIASARYLEDTNRDGIADVYVQEGTARGAYYRSIRAPLVERTREFSVVYTNNLSVKRGQNGK